MTALPVAPFGVLAIMSSTHLRAIGKSMVLWNHLNTLPVQSLDPSLPSAAEQKQRVGERIQPELLLNQRSKAINTKPEVGAAAGDYDAVFTGEIIQHDFRTRSTVSTVAASAPL